MNRISFFLSEGFFLVWQCRHETNLLSLLFFFFNSWIHWDVCVCLSSCCRRSVTLWKESVSFIISNEIRRWTCFVASVSSALASRSENQGRSIWHLAASGRLWVLLDMLGDCEKQSYTRRQMQYVLVIDLDLQVEWIWWNYVWK